MDGNTTSTPSVGVPELAMSTSNTTGTAPGSKVAEEGAGDRFFSDPGDYAPDDVCDYGFLATDAAAGGAGGAGGASGAGSVDDTDDLQDDLEFDYGQYATDPAPPQPVSLSVNSMPLFLVDGNTTYPVTSIARIEALPKAGRFRVTLLNGQSVKVRTEPTATTWSLFRFANGEPVVGDDSSDEEGEESDGEGEEDDDDPYGPGMIEETEDVFDIISGVNTSGSGESEDDGVSEHKEDGRVSDAGGASAEEEEDSLSDSSADAQARRRRRTVGAGRGRPDPIGVNPDLLRMFNPTGGQDPLRNLSQLLGTIIGARAPEVAPDAPPVPAPPPVVSTATSAPTEAAGETATSAEATTEGADA